MNRQIETTERPGDVLYTDLVDSDDDGVATPERSRARRAALDEHRRRYRELEDEVSRSSSASVPASNSKHPNSQHPNSTATHDVPLTPPMQPIMIPAQPPFTGTPTKASFDSSHRVKPDASLGFPSASSQTASELFMLRERVKTLELQNTILRMARRPPSQRRVAPGVANNLAYTAMIRLLSRYWSRFRIYSATQRYASTAIRDLRSQKGKATLARHQGPRMRHADSPRLRSPSRETADYFEDEASPFTVTNQSYIGESPRHHWPLMTSTENSTLELQRYAARVTAVCQDQRDVIETLRHQLAYVQERIGVREAPQHLHALRQAEIAVLWATDAETQARRMLELDEREARRASLDVEFETLRRKVQSVRWALELETVARFRAKEIQVAETQERMSIVSIEGPERALAGALEANRRLRAEVAKRELPKDTPPVSVLWPQRSFTPSVKTPPRPEEPLPELALSPPSQRRLLASPVSTPKSSDMDTGSLSVSPRHKAPRLLSPAALPTSPTTSAVAENIASLVEEEAVSRRHEMTAFLDRYDSLMEFFIQCAIELEERTPAPDRNFSFASMVTSDGGD